MNKCGIDSARACSRGGVVGYALTALFALKLCQASDTRRAFPEADGHRCLQMAWVRSGRMSVFMVTVGYPRSFPPCRATSAL